MLQIQVIGQLEFVHICGHPLYEDVNWNSASLRDVCVKPCHPLYEDVNWNEALQSITEIPECHPLYEDVNWNKNTVNRMLLQNGSSSIWGCELKYGQSFLTVQLPSVILYMRMWIEIVREVKKLGGRAVILYMRMWIEISAGRSPRSISCRHPLYEDVNWNIAFMVHRFPSSVILYMRMWIEIFPMSRFSFPNASSSIWGCELKLENRWV